MLWLVFSRPFPVVRDSHLVFKRRHEPETRQADKDTQPTGRRENQITDNLISESSYGDAKYLYDILSFCPGVFMECRTQNKGVPNNFKSRKPAKRR